MSRFIVLPKDAGTKMRIIHAVDQPLKDMTVDAICRKSGVSKQTFYRHFATKYDMSIWFTDTIEKATLNEIGRSLSWYEALSGYFQLAQEELEFIQFSRTPGESSWQRKTPERHETIYKTFGEHRHLTVDEDMAVYIEMYVVIEAYFASQFFKRTLIGSPDTLALRLENCVPQPLHAALNI